MKSVQMNNARTRGRARRWLAVLVPLALLAAACSGGDEVSDPVATESEAPEAQATEPSSEDTAAAGDDASSDGESWDDVVAAAAEEPTLTWLESTPTEQMQPLLEAFNAEYPDIEVEHVRNTGGASIAAQIVQESAAGADTADVASGVGDQMFEMWDRGLLRTDLTPEMFRVEDERNVPEDYLTITAHTTYVLAYNEERVGDNPPTGYDDLIDPAWQGRIASRFVSTPFANNVVVWGEDQATEYVESFAANEPLLYTSGFTIATDLAAGEFDAALTVYHTTVPTIEAGAPIEVVILDPTPTAAIYSVILAETDSPNAARVFLSWLMTEEGALAYEGATNRGNIFIESTETAALYADVELAEWPPSQTETYAEWSTRFNEVLTEGGQAADEE